MFKAISKSYADRQGSIFAFKDKEQFIRWMSKEFNDFDPEEWEKKKFFTTEHGTQHGESWSEYHEPFEINMTEID